MSELDELLLKFKQGEIDQEQLKIKLEELRVIQLGQKLRLDPMRKYRAGFPEAVLALGKSPQDAARALIKLAELNGIALATKASRKVYLECQKLAGDGIKLEYHPRAKVVVAKSRDHSIQRSGKVGILAAGTADVPVAEEARITLESMGIEVIKAYDVGIAGLHRLIQPLKQMLEEDVDALIVVAGMEGALPSVVAGLVSIPVIGVPSSTGYGLGAGGRAALYSMLQSCTPGLGVVNIDNGFGAGVLAGLISKRRWIKS